MRAEGETRTSHIVPPRLQCTPPWKPPSKLAVRNASRSANAQRSVVASENTKFDGSVTVLVVRAMPPHCGEVMGGANWAEALQAPTSVPWNSVGIGFAGSHLGSRT